MRAERCHPLCHKGSWRKVPRGVQDTRVLCRATRLPTGSKKEHPARRLWQVLLARGFSQRPHHWRSARCAPTPCWRYHNAHPAQKKTIQEVENPSHPSCTAATTLLTPRGTRGASPGLSLAPEPRLLHPQASWPRRGHPRPPALAPLAAAGGEPASSAGFTTPDAPGGFSHVTRMVRFTASFLAWGWSPQPGRAGILRWMERGAGAAKPSQHPRARWRGGQAASQGGWKSSTPPQRAASGEKQGTGSTPSPAALGTVT